MANLTLNQCRQSLLNLKKDLSDVSQDVFLEWSNFANRQLYNFINGIDPERNIDFSNTFTVTASPQTSALPADFQNIQPQGCGLFRIDDNGDDTEDQLAITTSGSRVVGYYISGTNIVFTGIENGTQFRLRYIPRLTTLTLMTETIILDEIYLEAFRNDLDTLYGQWDEEPGAESLADFRFVRTLNELANNIKKQPDAWHIPDFSIDF